MLEFCLTQEHVALLSGFSETLDVSASVHLAMMLREKYGEARKCREAEPLGPTGKSKPLTWNSPIPNPRHSSYFCHQPYDHWPFQCPAHGWNTPYGIQQLKEIGEVGNVRLISFLLTDDDARAEAKRQRQRNYSICDSGKLSNARREAKNGINFVLQGLIDGTEIDALIFLKERYIDPRFNWVKWCQESNLLQRAVKMCWSGGKLVSLIRHCGADPGFVFPGGRTLLLKAVEVNQHDAVACFLSRDNKGFFYQSALAETTGGNTILHLAAGLESAAIMNYIIVAFPELRPMLSVKNRCGQTALLFAAENDAAPCVEWILDQPGIDVNATDNCKWTVLHYAAFRDNKYVARAAMRHRDVHLNLKSNDSTTPLETALCKGSWEVAEELLDDSRTLVQINMMSVLLTIEERQLGVEPPIELVEQLYTRLGQGAQAITKEHLENWLALTRTLDCDEELISFFETKLQRFVS